MEYLTHNISENLKRIRSSRGISLDAVAEQTGVSKSMLYQIEHSDANPTISVLGRIASGLRIEFNELIKTPPEQSCLVRTAEVYPIKDVPGDHTVRTCFPFEDNQKIEIYRIDIEPGGSYVSGSHGRGTKEYLAVLEGTAEIDTGTEVCHVGTDELLRFDSEYTHIYRNTGNIKAKILCFFVV